MGFLQASPAEGMPTIAYDVKCLRACGGALYCALAIRTGAPLERRAFFHQGAVPERLVTAKMLAMNLLFHEALWHIGRTSRFRAAQGQAVRSPFDGCMEVTVPACMAIFVSTCNSTELLLFQSIEADPADIGVGLHLLEFHQADCFSRVLMVFEPPIVYHVPIPSCLLTCSSSASRPSLELAGASTPRNAPVAVLQQCVSHVLVHREHVAHPLDGFALLPSQLLCIQHVVRLLRSSLHRRQRPRFHFAPPSGRIIRSSRRTHLFAACFAAWTAPSAVVEVVFVDVARHVLVQAVVHRTKVPGCGVQWCRGNGHLAPGVTYGMRRSWCCATNDRSERRKRHECVDERWKVQRRAREERMCTCTG